MFILEESVDEGISLEIFFHICDRFGLIDAIPNLEKIKNIADGNSEAKITINEETIIEEEPEELPKEPTVLMVDKSCNTDEYIDSRESKLVEEEEDHDDTSDQIEEHFMKIDRATMKINLPKSKMASARVKNHLEILKEYRSRKNEVSVLNL